MKQTGETAQRVSASVEAELAPYDALRMSHPLHQLGAHLNAPADRVSIVTVPGNWTFGTLTIPEDKAQTLLELFSTGHVLPTQSVAHRKSRHIALPVAFASTAAVHTFTRRIGGALIQSKLPSDRTAFHAPKQGLFNVFGRNAEQITTPKEGPMIVGINDAGYPHTTSIAQLHPVLNDTAFSGASLASARVYRDPINAIPEVTTMHSSYALVDCRVRNDGFAEFLSQLNDRFAASNIKLAQLGDALEIFDTADQSEIARIVELLEMFKLGNMRAEVGRTKLSVIPGTQLLVAESVNYDNLHRLRAGNTPDGRVIIEPRQAAEIRKAAGKKGATQQQRVIKYGKPRLQVDELGRTLCDGIDYEYGLDVLKTPRIIGKKANENFKDLNKALGDPRVRLVVLRGPGASGKSTLLMHAIEKTKSPALICPPNDTNRDLPGVAMLDVFRSIQERIGDKPSHPDQKEFLKFMKRSTAEKRQLIASEKTQKEYIDLAARTLHSLNVNFGLEDLHQMGASLKEAQILIESYINRSKKALITGRQNYLGEEKITDEIIMNVRTKYGYDSVVVIDTEGVEFSVLEYCVQKFEDCVGDLSRFTIGGVTPAGIDGATALAVGYASGTNPQKFADIVVDLMDTGQLSIQDNGYLGCKPELHDGIRALQPEGVYTQLISRRVTDLQRDPVLGKPVKFAADCIATLGKISTEQLERLLMVLPDAEGRIAEIIELLTKGKQIREVTDPVTQKRFLRPAQDLTREQLLESMDEARKSELGKILDTFYKDSLDSDARFSLRMYRALGYQKEKALALDPTKIEDLDPNIAEFIGELSASVHEYVADLKGSNSVDEIRKVTARVLALPVVQNTMQNLMTGRYTTEHLDNPALQKMAQMITTCLFEKGWADCEQAQPTGAELCAKNLESISRSTDTFFVNKWDLSRLHFMISIVGHEPGDPKFVELFEALKKNLPEATETPRSALHSPRPDLGTAGSTLTETDYIYAEHLVDATRAHVHLSSYRFRGPYRAAYEENDAYIKKLMGMAPSGTQTQEQQTDPTTESLTKLRKVTTAWSKRYWGVPSTLQTEFYRNQQFMVPYHLVISDIEKPHFFAMIGDTPAIQFTEDSYRETPMAIDKDNRARLEQVSTAIQELFTINGKFPTALNSYQLGSLYPFAAQVEQMKGNFAQEMEYLKKGLTFALNTGNFALASRCVKLVVNGMALKAQVHHDPQSADDAPQNKWQLRAVPDLRTLGNAIDFIEGKEATTAVTNLDPRYDVWKNLIMPVTKVEAYGSYARAFTERQIQQLCAIVSNVDENQSSLEKKLEARARLIDLAARLNNGFKAVQDLEQVATENYSSEVPYYGGSQAAYMQRTTEALRRHAGTLVGALPDFSTLACMQPDSALNGVMYGVGHFRDNPLFVIPNSKALMDAALENIANAPDLLQHLDHYTDTVLRFSLSEDGRTQNHDTRIDRNSAIVNPNPNFSSVAEVEGGRKDMRYFQERDPLSLHSPFNMEPHQQAYLEKVKEECAARQVKEPQNASLTIAHAECNLMLGDFMSAMHDVSGIDTDVDNEILKRASRIYANALFWNSMLTPVSQNGDISFATKKERNGDELKKSFDFIYSLGGENPEYNLMQATTINEFIRLHVMTNIHTKMKDPDCISCDIIREKGDTDETWERKVALAKKREAEEATKAYNGIRDMVAEWPENYREQLEQMIPIGCQTLTHIAELISNPPENQTQPQRVHLITSVAAHTSALIDAITALRLIKLYERNEYRQQKQRAEGDTYSFEEDPIDQTFASDIIGYTIRDTEIINIANTINRDTNVLGRAITNLPKLIHMEQSFHARIDNEATQITAKLGRHIILE